MLVRLGVADVRTGAVTWIDLGTDTDIYLARVNWLPDGRTLAIQRESRDQRRLDLLFADIETGRSRVVLTETSDTWIDLNDELTFLKQSPRIHLGLGARRLQAPVSLRLRRAAGAPAHRRAPGVVDDFRARAIKAIDEKHRLIYFTATEKSPRERQLYRTSLDTQDPQQGRRASRRRRACTASPCRADARFYVDNFTSTHPAAAGEPARAPTAGSWPICSRIAWTRSIRTRPISRTTRCPSSAP